MLHSTETALPRVQHDISSDLDKNRAMLFVVLDLSSAFDTIDHEHLLTLLHDEYGVRETALSWFRAYLENRTHCVQTDSKTSATIPLQSGVPQGLVLRPVILTLYTTPMQRMFKRHGTKYHKYVDDFQLYNFMRRTIPLHQATKWKLRGDSRLYWGGRTMDGFAHVEIKR